MTEMPLVRQKSPRDEQHRVSGLVGQGPAGEWLLLPSKVNVEIKLEIVSDESITYGELSTHPGDSPQAFVPVVFSRMLQS